MASFATRSGLRRLTCWLIFLWRKRKNEAREIWRTCRRHVRRRRRKRKRRRRRRRRRHVRIWKAPATGAANKFITQQGCLVLTLILGPEQWVMNIFYDKWRRLTSEAVVGANLHSLDHLDNTWCLGRRGRNVSSLPSDALHDSADGFLIFWSSGPRPFIPSLIMAVDLTWE